MGAQRMTPGQRRERGSIAAARWPVSTWDRQRPQRGVPMSWIEGKGWLIVGAVLAVGVPLFGLHRSVTAGLGAWLPLPWADMILGTLLFMACAGIYFRSHWEATARMLREREERLAAIAAAIDGIGADLERSGAVMTENLVEVGRDPNGVASGLYLEGARAHAERLPRLAARLRGLLRPSGPGGAT